MRQLDVNTLRSDPILSRVPIVQTGLGLFKKKGVFLNTK